MPYGYDTLLRLVVCLASAVIGWQWRTRTPGWSAAFVLTALLFNPVIRVEFDRALWPPIDIAVAALFAVHWVRHARGRRPGTTLSRRSE
jgi:hypothetical protein